MTTKHYQGACHCGAVTFSVEMEMANLATCNCSICGKTGAIMAFLPAEKLQKTAGKNMLTDYQFGKKNIHHTFCSVCGVRPYATGVGPDGKPAAMVNVRCIDGIDAHTVEVAHRFDGKSL